MADLHCKACGRKLPKTLARVPYVVVTANGATETAGYTCEDCAYLAAHTDAKRLPAPPRVNRKHPQRESLLDPYNAEQTF